MDLVFKNSTATPAPISSAGRHSKRGRDWSGAGKKYNSIFFERVLLTALSELGLGKKNISVSVNLVGETQIKNLNKKYRKKDRVTDVLSFPIHEELEIRNWKLEIPKSNTSVFDLGDIFICLSFAKKAAKSENISIDSKLVQLTVHGFLHLVGYDHERSGKDADKMFKLEAKILKKLTQ